MQNIIKLSPDDKLHISENNEVDVEQWDREKWSRDNPMDYIKSVKIINSYPADFSPDLFKEIYKITRLHIPQVLYKFYSITDDEKLNKLQLETLYEKKAFLSELSQFNDPFDGRAIFYNPKKLMSFAELREHEGRLIDDFASYHVGTSLSATNYMNMPMWAHYSNNHRGYCVSYKTSENPTINTFAFPIQYLDARIDITEYMTRFVEYALAEKKKQAAQDNKQIILSDHSFVLIIDLLENIKGVDWSYEKEFRISLPKTHPTCYIDLKPHQIFVGKNCNFEESLFKIGKHQNIEVFKLKQGTTDEGFEIKPVPLYSLK